MAWLLTWIILGLAAGFIASRTVSGMGPTVMTDIIIGIAGALVGGWLFDTFGRAGVAGFNPIRTIGRAGVAGFNLYSLFMALVGAVLLLAAYRAVGTLLARLSGRDSARREAGGDQQTECSSSRSPAGQRSGVGRWVARYQAGVGR